MKCFNLVLKHYTILNQCLKRYFTETDSGKSMALVLLDLSSVFDLVDHEVLLTHLEISVPSSWDGTAVVLIIFD